IFPETLGTTEEESFFRAVNAVRPGLIRGDAYEVTYGLHIILRFEPEQELLAGTVATRDLPEIWNGRMKEYRGVDGPDDAPGVLRRRRRRHRQPLRGAPRHGRGRARPHSPRRPRAGAQRARPAGERPARLHGGGDRFSRSTRSPGVRARDHRDEGDRTGGCCG